MLVAIYKAAGIHNLLKWVDNFFVVRLVTETWTEHDFTMLTDQIGVP